MSIVTQGTDAQGEQVNIQETVGLTASASASSSDEDAGADDVPTSGVATGGDTEIVDSTVQAHGNITDALTGTIVAVDPTTRIKTTTTDNISVTGTDDENDQDDETDIRTQSGAAGSSENDTANQTNSSTLVINSSGAENITETNPDGSSAERVHEHDRFRHRRAISASVNLARSADGTTTTTPSGTETGSSTSSDPAVGSSTWSNQPLDQTSLDSFASNAAPLSDVSASGAGTGGSTGTGGGSGSTGGNNGGSADGSTTPPAPIPGAEIPAIKTVVADLCDGAKEKQAAAPAKVKTTTPYADGTVDYLYDNGVILRLFPDKSMATITQNWAGSKDEPILMSIEIDYLSSPQVIMSINYIETGGLTVIKYPASEKGRGGIVQYAGAAEVIPSKIVPPNGATEKPTKASIIAKLENKLWPNGKGDGTELEISKEINEAIALAVTAKTDEGGIQPTEIGLKFIIEKIQKERAKPEPLPAKLKRAKDSKIAPIPQDK